jgi:hypothetical protein
MQRFGADTDERLMLAGDTQRFDLLHLRRQYVRHPVPANQQSMRLKN